MPMRQNTPTNGAFLANDSEAGMTADPAKIRRRHLTRLSSLSIAPLPGTPFGHNPVSFKHRSHRVMVWIVPGGMGQFGSHREVHFLFTGSQYPGMGVLANFANTLSMAREADARQVTLRQCLGQASPSRCLFLRGDEQTWARFATSGQDLDGRRHLPQASRRNVPGQ